MINKTFFKNFLERRKLCTTKCLLHIAEPPALLIIIMLIFDMYFKKLSLLVFTFRSLNTRLKCKQK